MIEENNVTRTILDSLAEAVVTIDKNFRITFINDAAKRITNFEKDEVIGSFCKNFFQSKFCELNCPIVYVLKTGRNVYDREAELMCKGNKSIPVKLNVAVLKDEQGMPSGGVISFRDITQLKELESGLNSEYAYQGMIAKSKEMREIFRLIEEISDTDVSVLITGETGTGKELVANAIYATGIRKNKPFIKVNCAVIPINLVSSELFGHVKGAFTDAKADRVGRFEMADGGTVFLDEIGDLPLEAQPQLLRFLQEGTFERLGDTKTRKADVRIIAATNQNIQQAIHDGTFREDLFYRLNVVEIDLPPLRKRQEDIPILINYFIRKYSKLYKKEILGIDAKSMEMLLNWKYPGNIRELENIIEHAVIRTRNQEEICVCHLPQPLHQQANCPQGDELPLEKSIQANKLVELLNEYKWNKTLVAKKLGIDRSTLWRRMKALGID